MFNPKWPPVGLSFECGNRLSVVDPENPQITAVLGVALLAREMGKK
ncbi:MAG: hypothetical protein ACYCVD_03290 [Desulfitobacteriaceae bacterium]